MLKKVAKNTSIVSFGTGISMFLGFVREILIAYFFGTSALLEAFIVSFRIPSLFRSIFAEGFFDSVATPVFSEYQLQKKELFKTGRNLLSLSAAAVIIFTIIGILGSKFFVLILAPGFVKDPLKFSMAVSFTRITFFYLFFICLSVNSFSILYALKKFFIPAITPVFLNISFIVGILFFSQSLRSHILVYCVLVGGFLQTLFPFLALKREGFSFKPNFRGLFKDKILVRMLKLFPPRLISSIVYQLSVMVDTVFASFSSIVGEGAIAALWFANRYIHIPLALFIISICRVVIVDLSFYHSKKKTDAFNKLFVFSFQNVVFFITPIAIIYMFLSGPIIEVVLRRGSFSAYSSGITSSVLFFYSFGLFFFCGIKLLVNSFYALKDTATPAKVTATCLVLNVILSALLMFPLKIGGVALGSSLAAMVNFFILFRIFEKRVGPIDWDDTRSQFIKVVFISLLTAIIARLLWDHIQMQKYIKAIIVASSSFSVFLIGGLFLKLKQIDYLREHLLAKISRK